MREDYFKPRIVHTVTDECTCPLGYNHTDEELERRYPELWRSMHTVL